MLPYVPSDRQERTFYFLRPSSEEAQISCMSKVSVRTGRIFVYVPEVPRLASSQMDHNLGLATISARWMAHSTRPSHVQIEKENP